MDLSHYILTLDWIKSHCNEVIGEWDGNESGKEEERADAAKEVLEHVAKIEEILANEL